MKKTNYLISFTMVILLALVLSSCEKTPEPTAQFSFAVIDLEVTFTNESDDATSYSWNFGDGNTSTETSPVHTYADYGLYSISMTATGEGGDATVTKDVEVEFIPLMTIDGDFSKWSSVADFVAGDGGTIKKVKLASDAKYLYIYIEGTDQIRGFFDVYIDADNSTSTGANTWIYPAGAGAEYLLEGFISDAGDADLFRDNPDTEDWCWTVDCSAAPVPVVPMGSGFITASSLNTVTGGKAIEFSLLRALATELGDNINIGFVDVAEDWSMQGGLPVIGAETSKLLPYSFN
ncbi:MAG: PKD domain-containing protein [Bacteroidetes bacterium]|nr:PKD domain-containing protein [Bacteroidota bacterium]